MIKRILVIGLVSYLAMALEFSLYNFLGPWGKPELLMLVVIFFNLYLGIRFSIIAAIICGILKDTIDLEPFGTHILVFLSASYVTTLVRRYIYQPGSRFSRLVVTFFVILGCFLVQDILIKMDHDIAFGQMLLFVLIPQLLTTMIVATYVFEQLKKISVYFTLKHAS